MRTRKAIEGAAEPVNGSNVKKLHNLKREIWSQIDSFESKSGKPLAKEIKSKLTDAYGDIVGKLRKQVPNYDNAMEEFIKQSPVVENLEKGLVGQLSKVKDTQLKQISRKLFDPEEAVTNPTVIRQTKELIQKTNPEAWNGIVRTEAERRLKNIDLTVREVTPDNLPAKVHSALFGSGSKRDLFLASLDGEAKQNALFVEEVLTRAAKGRPGGSQTGVRSVINDKLKGLKLTIYRFLENPYKRLISTGEDAAFNKSAERMADALFDPNWTPQLSKIRKTKDIPAAIKAMSQLLKGDENGD